MVTQLFQYTSSYIISIGLHAAILVVLLTNLSFPPPTSGPIIRASVYFEQPKPIKKTPVIKYKSSKTAVKIKQKSSKLIKPKITHFNRMQFTSKNPKLNSQQLVTKPQLNMTGFLRTNDFTKYSANAAPSSITKKSDSSLFSLPQTLSGKINMNPIAPDSVTRKITDQLAISKTASIKNPDTDLDINLSKITATDSEFSKKWKRQSDSKLHRKSIAYKISSNWKIPPIALSDFEIIIEIFLSKTGQITQFGFKQLAHLAILNAAAERAVKLSAPFDPLPEAENVGKDAYRVVLRFTPDNTAN